jgi:hypothetical protein
LILDTTNKSVKVALASAKTTNELDITASWEDITPTTFTPGAGDIISNGTTPVVAVPSPASTTQRRVKYISIYNSDTTPAIVTVSYANGANSRTITKQTLAVGETLQYNNQAGWDQRASTLNPIGRCYLRQSGANLQLIPLNGNQLMVNSITQVIPDAGVSLSPTGTLASTFYYVYACMAAGVMALEFSITGYANQAGTGVKVKTGDPTRTLVGIWSSSTANTWSTVATEGLSYFNPSLKMSIAGPLAPTTTSTTLVEMASGSRVGFVTFAERLVRFGIRGRMTMSTNGSSGDVDIGIDGVNQGLIAQVRNQAAAAANNSDFFSDFHFNTFNETRHYITGVFKTSAGTLTCADLAYFVMVQG